MWKKLLSRFCSLRKKTFELPETVPCYQPELPFDKTEIHFISNHCRRNHN